MMKKVNSLFLAVIMTLLFVACTPANIDSNPSYNSNTINLSQFTFATGDGEVENDVSKSAFTKPIECMYKGAKITISTPKFTGIPTESVYSHKSNYQFIDGYVIFDVSTDDGLMYFKVDKNGKTVDVNSDYQIITDGRDKDKYISQFIQAENNTNGRIVGNNVKIKQFGESGSYVQYLYSLDDKRLSNGYDSISYFFGGLALVTNDNKIGLIDENGSEILAPSILFDTIIYPPKNRGYDLNFMFEDAFIISIGGEFAVINIQR